MGQRDGGFAGILGVAAAAAAMAVQLVGERARPGYDNAAEFISELGERGTPDGAWVSWAGFLPIGLLSIAFGLVAWRALRSQRRIAWGALVVGVGVGLAYVVSAVARCEPGCPSDGDLAQTIHNTLGGALEYLGAAIGMLLVGLGARRVAGWKVEAVASLVAAPLVLVASALAERGSLAEWRGLSQRAAEVVIFSWMILIGLRAAVGEPAEPTPASDPVV